METKCRDVDTAICGRRTDGGQLMRLVALSLAARFLARPGGGLCLLASLVVEVNLVAALLLTE